MKFKYDKQADAVYIYLSHKQYAYGKDLDDERRIDYASDHTPIGVELLCVSKGVNMNGIPRADEITNVLEAEGIKTYILEQQPSIPWQGYSNVVFNVNIRSSAPKEVEESHIKEEVTA